MLVRALSSASGVQHYLLANVPHAREVAFGVMQGDAPDEAVNIVAARQQKFRQMRTILARDPRNKRPSLHGAPSLPPCQEFVDGDELRGCTSGKSSPMRGRNPTRNISERSADLLRAARSQSKRR
jgi:hypothetical protein